MQNSLLGTSMNAISLDPRVCYVFLNSVLLHYVQWQEFQDGLAVGQAGDSQIQYVEITLTES